MIMPVVWALTPGTADTTSASEGRTSRRSWLKSRLAAGSGLFETARLSRVAVTTRGGSWRTVSRWAGTWSRSSRMGAFIMYGIIRTMDPSTLNAFITPIEPGPGRPGRLSGVRFATKDLIATAGVRTTAGSLILKDWVPERSAPIVRQLEALGAVNVGKTNTHEFAFGTTNDNPHYGAAKNP